MALDDGHARIGATEDAEGTTATPAALDYRALFEATPGLHLVLAPDAPRFTMLAASDQRLAATLTTREACVGRPLFEVFSDANPEHAARNGVVNLRASLETVLRTRRPHRMPRQRFDLRRPDGTWEVRQWEPYNVPVLGPGGEVRYILHHVEDVTELARRSADAAAAEGRAVRILEQMGDGLVVVDHAFRILDVNAAAERLLGTPRDRLIGRSHWEAFPGSVGAEPERQYRRVQAERVEAHFTHHYVDAGRDFHAEVDGYPTDEGGVAIFWRDVTARVEAEAALRASEARYRALFASIDEGFCVIEVLFDADGRPADYRFLEANPAFIEQTGLADAIGRTIRELAPTHEAHWFEIYGRVATTGESTRFEAPAEALGRWYEVYAFRVGLPSEGRVAVLFKDVAERKRAEAERERLLAAERAARTEAEWARVMADAANRAKSEFLAVMSHELRTPLNAIGGYAELLELGIRGPVTEAQRADLARIQASQRHLLGLIAGVLDYSRVEAGVVAYRLTDVPVSQAVAEAEALVAPQLRAKGLGYAWAGAAPELCERADREKLQQVLLNLLGNAVKFTDARDGVPGRVEVSCTVETLEAVDAVDARAPAGRVHLRVRDTGQGIAADQLERIFEPFVQVDQRLTRPHAGVGLGLAISRDLARGMGGDLTVESTPGAGSTFTLTLPSA